MPPSYTKKKPKKILKCKTAKRQSFKNKKTSNQSIPWWKSQKPAKPINNSKKDNLPKTLRFSPLKLNGKRVRKQTLRKWRFHKKNWFTKMIPMARCQRLILISIMKKKPIPKICLEWEKVSETPCLTSSIITNEWYCFRLLFHWMNFIGEFFIKIHEVHA